MSKTNEHSIEKIMWNAEMQVASLRGCSIECARTYLRGYLRDKERERVDFEQAAIETRRSAATSSSTPTGDKV